MSRTSINRLITAASLAALALAAPAAAKSGSHAKTYRATLAPTAAAAVAGVPDVTGKAQLVDGKKNNKVSVHVRNLKPGETYLWHVHQAKAAGDPCAAGSAVANPDPYPGWVYRPLVANESGNANSKGVSTTFPVAAPVDTGQAYYVNVHLQDGTVIACGVLQGKRAKQHSSHSAGAKSHGHGKHA